MSYLNDLDKCMLKADEYMATLEECKAKGYWTAFNFTAANLKSMLKTVRFCIDCAKRKADRAEVPVQEFSCVGGCIRPMSLRRWKDITSKLPYVLKLIPKE
jgi:hypothetical protein